MLAAERHRLILQTLEQQGVVRVAHMAEVLSVTEETVRRDLDKLEEDGQLMRRHGGAIPVEHDEVENRETSHRLRERLHVDEKSAIADVALRFVHENDTIALDASSTALFLAERIPNMPLAVLTNSAPVAMALSQKPLVRVLCAGGTLSPASLSFVGPLAAEFMGRFHADKAFLSCRALDSERGLSDANDQQALVRTRMLEISDRAFVMVDHSKLGKRALFSFAPLRPEMDIITTSETDSELLDRLRARVGAVHLAGTLKGKPS